MGLFSSLKDKSASAEAVTMNVLAPASVRLEQKSLDVQIEFQSHSTEILNIQSVELVLSKQTDEDGLNNEEVTHMTHKEPVQLMPNAAQSLTLSVPLTTTVMMGEISSLSNTEQTKTTAKVLNFIDNLTAATVQPTQYILEIMAQVNNGQMLNETRRIRLDLS
jgi:hypothetical protein